MRNIANYDVTVACGYVCCPLNGFKNPLALLRVLILVQGLWEYGAVSNQGVGYIINDLIKDHHLFDDPLQKICLINNTIKSTSGLVFIYKCLKFLIVGFSFMTFFYRMPYQIFIIGDLLSENRPFSQIFILP